VPDNFPDFVKELDEKRRRTKKKGGRWEGK
jgi:hypothetical protein